MQANSFFIRQWINGDYYNLTQRSVATEQEGLAALLACPQGQQMELWGYWHGIGEDLIKTTNY